MDVGFDEVKGLVLRTEALHSHTHRLYHTDSVGQLDFALVSVARLHDVFGDLPSHVCCGAIHLGGVFTAQSTATHATDATVGIARQLPASHTTVSIAAAQHETTGRINQLREVTIQTVLAGGQHHHGFDDMPEVADLHIRAVLHGAEEGGDSAGVVIVADLRLGICSKHLGRMVLQQLQELGGDHVRNRHLLCRLVGGVAVHDALITGTALVHTHCNIRRLLVHQNADAEKLGQVPAQLFSTDAVEHIVNDLVVVWPIIGSDFAGNKKLALFQQTLDCHTGVPVMLENVGHDGICDLVTDLIGMTIADLFTGNNLTHVLSSLSCITKQAAFAHAHK